MAADWNGFPLEAGEFAGHEFSLVVPRESHPTRPWIWRTEFFGHEPQLDVALLQQGWHVAYYRINDMYGAPLAVQLMGDFFQFVTSHFQLNSQCVVEGFSRGGLYAAEFALKFPHRVAAMYLDNPVLDIRSWPGGLGGGPGNAGCWQECLAVYGFNESELAGYSAPVDRAETLVQHKIPLLAVCGDADEVVSYPENGEKLVESYQRAGAPFHLILKPGGLHHPHSVEDPAPLVTYLQQVLPENFPAASA